MSNSQRAWPALITVLGGSFLHLLDTTIVSAAAEEIRRDLGGTGAATQWLVAGYTVPFAGLLVLGGWLGDRFGRKRMVVAGSAAFGLASVVCALAGDASTLILARGLQGVSSAMAVPQVFPVIAHFFHGPARGAALGAQGGVIALATVSGPMLGGWLAGSFGWRWIFLINVPVSAITTVAAIRFLPGPTAAIAGKSVPGISLAGLMVSVSLIVVPLIEGPSRQWPWWTVLLPAAGITLGLTTLLGQGQVERRGGTPLLPQSLLHHPPFVAGSIAAMLTTGGISAFFLLLAVDLQANLQHTPQATGLLMSAWAAGALMTSASSAIWPPKPRQMLFGGAAMAVGPLLLAVVRAGDTPNWWTMALCLTIGGAGMGAFSPQLYRVALSGADSTHVGGASGMFSTLGQTGGAFGVAALGAIYYDLSGADEVRSAAVSVDVVVGILFLAATVVVGRAIGAAEKS